MSNNEPDYKDNLFFDPQKAKDCVVRIEDSPVFMCDLEAWKKESKINRIKYEVGDECVFEITKGDKKWVIPLDDFFDKVIQICGENKDDGSK